MATKTLTIKLIGFKANGKYYSKYDTTGTIQYMTVDNEEYPYLPDAIDLVELAKKKGKIPCTLDYLIDNGVPHFIKTTTPE